MKLGLVALGVTITFALGACTAPPGESDSAHTAGVSTALPSIAELEATTTRALENSGVPGSLVLITDDQGESVPSSQGYATLTSPRATDTDNNADTDGGSDDLPADNVISDSSILAYRSITKSFIGTVVLQLADEGKL